MLSEKVELLGKGLYDDIPDELTITAMATVSELEYVGAEDFDETMLTKILPESVEEKIDFNRLLEIDYQWLCRCLRLLNFGPYHSTNSIFCPECGKTHYGSYGVDLRTIDVKVLPEGFKNDIVIKAGELMDYPYEIHLKLLTIRQSLAAYKDKAFQRKDGKMNRELARICYMIHSMNGEEMTSPLDTKLIIQKDFSPADYAMLKSIVDDLTDYGLRAGGKVACPVCGHPEAVYIALTDDRFFRCSLDNLRKWRDDRNSGKDKNISRGKTAAVREHN